MMAVFFFIAHEKGFKSHAQPQTGAYSCSDNWRVWLSGPILRPQDLTDNLKLSVFAVIQFQKTLFGT